MPINVVSLKDYRRLVGTPLGTSGWFVLDQARIDRFAEVTEDRQFIHVDPVAAAKTPFGGTIAHGFLSLSMLSVMASVIPSIAGSEMAVNYGLNSVRFLKPVAAGQRVRGNFVLKGIEERGPGRWQSTFAVTIEIESEEKPALVAEWLILSVLAGPSSRPEAKAGGSAT